MRKVLPGEIVIYNNLIVYLTINDANKTDYELHKCAHISDQEDGFPAPLVGKRAPVENGDHGRDGVEEGVAHVDDRGSVLHQSDSST